MHERMFLRCIALSGNGFVYIDAPDNDVIYDVTSMLTVCRPGAFKGVDREKSAVFKELTQSFRTYEPRGQAKKKKL